MRIVSFVPAATYLTCELGMRDQLVGVTHECGTVADLTGSEARVLTRSRVPTGGSSAVIDQAVRNAAANKNELHVFDARLLEELAPDLVFVPADLPEGRTPCSLSFYDIRRTTSTMPTPPRLVAFGPNSLPEIYGAARAAGEALGRGADTLALLTSLRERADAIRHLATRARKRPRVALLSWVHPPVEAGGLLAQLVLLAGGQPLTTEPASRSRSMDWPQLLALSPQVIVLAPCSFPLDRVKAEVETLRKVAGLSDVPAARWGQIHAVDAARWFSAPGIGSIRALEILAGVIHPELPWPDSVLADNARPVAID